MPEFVDAGTHDFMSHSNVLRRHGSTRVFFDVTNSNHQASLKQFIETGNWGDVHFFPEYPFTDAPMTALMKFAGHHLNAQRESLEQRSARVLALRRAGQVTIFVDDVAEVAAPVAIVKKSIFSGLLMKFTDYLGAQHNAKVPALSQVTTSAVEVIHVEVEPAAVEVEPAAVEVETIVVPSAEPEKVDAAAL